MANTIKIRRSAVPGKVPLVGDLSLGELALNTYDGKLYAKRNQNGTEQVVALGGIQYYFSATPPTGVDAGTIWTDSDDGVTYIYLDDGNSLQWMEFGAGGTGLSYYYSATPPPNSTPGTIWTNSENGTTYIYIDDGDSLQWIELSGKGGGGGASTPILQTAKVINSNFAIQEGYNGLSAGTVEVANGYSVTVPANTDWVIV